MAKLFEWLANLSPWYQAIMLALFFGVGLGAVMALATGNPGNALAAMVVGSLLGLLYCYRERRDPHSWLLPSTDETDDHYPEELKLVERRRAMQDVILIPVFAITGIAISWIIFGTGVYGLLGAFVAMFLVSWTLGRFGGPNDPQWKTVRDEWRRSHAELSRKT